MAHETGRWFHTFAPLQSRTSPFLAHLPRVLQKKVQSFGLDSFLLHLGQFFLSPLSFHLYCFLTLFGLLFLLFALLVVLAYPFPLLLLLRSLERLSFLATLGFTLQTFHFLLQLLLLFRQRF
jgi:hypothetical protein